MPDFSHASPLGQALGQQTRCADIGSPLSEWSQRENDRLQAARKRETSGPYFSGIILLALNLSDFPFTPTRPGPPMLANVTLNGRHVLLASSVSSMVCNLKNTLYSLFFALARLMALTNPEVRLSRLLVDDNSCLASPSRSSPTHHNHLFSTLRCVVPRALRRVWRCSCALHNQPQASLPLSPSSTHAS